MNQQGVGYKNFIPATFGSQVAGRFSARSGVHPKQTTLHPATPRMRLIRMRKQCFGVY